MISQLGADIDPQASDDELGNSVSLSSDGSRVAVGAPYNDDGDTDAGLVKLYDWNGTNWIQAGDDIYGEATDDRSGWSVSLSGDGSTVAIGAPKNDGTGSDAGHVRLYEWNAITLEWDMFGEIDGEATDDESGTSVSLSNDGSRVAIGAPYNDGASGSNADAGHVRVYKWDGANWTQVIADIDGDVAGDRSGYSVSLSGNGLTVAVGAPRNDDAFADAGQVKLYEWDTTDSALGWSQLSTAIKGGAVGDESGSSVSLSSDGTTVAIGSPYFSDGGSKVYAGQVNVYKWDGAAWTQVGADIDADAEDLLGFSVSLSSDGTTVAIGGPNNREDINYAGHVRVYELIGATWTQVSADINGEAGGDESGRSVSLSGDGSRVAIGAPYNDGAGAYAGHVRLYDWSGMAWIQVGVDIDGDAAGNEFGSSVALSGDGSRVAIGSKYNDEGGKYAGQVKLYDWNGTTWIQVGDEINGEAQLDYSGYSVSLSADGSTVAVGATGNDGEDETNSKRGHVRVYKLIGAHWTQVGPDIDGDAADDNSGSSVSLSGDGSTVAVGAPGNDAGGTSAGQVKLYRLIDGTTWIQAGADIYGETSYDRSGYSVSLSGDGSTVAVGAISNDGDDETDSRRGHVRVYQLIGPTWTQVGADIDGEAQDDYSGSSVSLSSDASRVAIGAPDNDGNGGEGSCAGHVRVYGLNGSVWNQVGGDIDGEAAGDGFGTSVSMSSDGSTVAVGAPGHPDGGPVAGHASVYKLSGATWTQVGADIDGKAAADQMGYSVSVSSDGSRIAIGAPTYSGAGSYSGHVRVFLLAYSVPVASAPYTGPLLTGYSDRAPQIGDEVVVTGLRLHLVTSCTIDGIEVAISNQSEGSFTIAIPSGVEPGLKSLVISSSAGALTVQDVLNVAAATAGSSEIISPLTLRAWTKKLTDSTVKIYTKNIVGAGKIQFMLNGEEIAWVRAVSAVDPKLRTANGAHYLVRTVDLVEGQKNVLEVYLDGVRIKRTAYSY